MRCPFCTHEDTKVTDSRLVAEGGQVRRRRECLACGERFTTFEVAEIFEVPLAFLLDRRNHERCSAEFEGRTRFFWAMPYGRHFIWGATAGMVINLCDILDGQ